VGAYSNQARVTPQAAPRQRHASAARHPRPAVRPTAHDRPRGTGCRLPPAPGRAAACRGWAPLDPAQLQRHPPRAIYGAASA